MRKKLFTVIGLGRFGASVARTLSGLGHDVLVIDKDAERIRNIADEVTHAVEGDATDDHTLRAIGIRNFDVVIVAIGQDIQASILTALNVKDLGVGRVIAKAQNHQHGKVLSKIGVDEVIYPERDMGARVAHRLASANVLDILELAPNYSVVEIAASERMHGKSLRQLDLRVRFGVNVIAVQHEGKLNISPKADDAIVKGDVLTVMGRNEDLQRLEGF
ncbi:MAG: TrkA family potassium uptake protein [Firmicutes bacterium]|nr:TrkA family potassium uptake protein [Bacillota bacterium]